MRPEKQFLLDEIQDKIQDSKSILVAKYNSIEPNLSWKFRTELSKAGGALKVVKKRIFQKAAEKCGITLSVDDLDGNIGIIFAANDPLETTKAVFKFTKDHEGMMEILLGHIEGKIYSAQDVKALSELPSLDEMRAQFLGLLEAPMSQTLSVMQSLLTSVMYCLENQSQKEPS